MVLCLDDFFFQAEDGIRATEYWREFRRVLFRSKTNYMSGGQMRCPIVFRGPNGAASRVAAQHSQNYGPWYASVPGLIVIAPYDAADAKGLIKEAIRSDDPVVFLENELVYGRSFDVPAVDDYVLPIGKEIGRASGRERVGHDV